MCPMEQLHGQALDLANTSQPSPLFYWFFPALNKNIGMERVQPHPHPQMCVCHNFPATRHQRGCHCWSQHCICPKLSEERLLLGLSLVQLVIYRECMDIFQVNAHLIVSGTVQLRWYVINFHSVEPHLSFPAPLTWLWNVFYDKPNPWVRLQVQNVFLAVQDSSIGNLVGQSVIKWHYLIKSSILIWSKQPSLHSFTTLLKRRLSYDGLEDREY